MLDIFHTIMTLFIVVDPIGLTPIFISLTAGFSRTDQLHVARLACLIAFSVLTVSAFIGQHLFAALGISLAAFRIAGGIFLFKTAFEMIYEQRQQRRESTAEKIVTRSEIKAIAACPLALPLLAGPGSITATILAASKAEGDLLSYGYLILSIFIVTLVAYLCFHIASKLQELLGEMGRIILSRLMGVILGGLAIQFVIDGLLFFFPISQ